MNNISLYIRVGWLADWLMATLMNKLPLSSCIIIWRKVLSSQLWRRKTLYCLQQLHFKKTTITSNFDRPMSLLLIFYSPFHNFFSNVHIHWKTVRNYETGCTCRDNVPWLDIHIPSSVQVGIESQKIYHFSAFLILRLRIV